MLLYLLEPCCAIWQVWKRGTYLRVDGSLMGLDEKSTSLIPQWKRGHFSLVFDGSTTPATLLFLDHRKARYLNLLAERKKHVAGMVDAEVGCHALPCASFQIAEVHAAVGSTWACCLGRGW